MDLSRLYLVIREFDESSGYRIVVRSGEAERTRPLSDFYTTDEIFVASILKSKKGRVFLFPEMKELLEADIILK